MPISLRLILQRVGLLLVAYLVCRFFFLCWNHSLYANDSSWEIVKAFVIGTRFDLSAILFSNAILIPLWILPPSWAAVTPVRWLERGLFALVNFICIGLNFVDVEFTRFIGKHVSYEYLLFQQDVTEQSVGIFQNYWPFFVGLLVLTGAVAWLNPSLPKAPPREKWLSGIVWRLAVIGLAVLGMRGGTQFKPILPMDAYFSSKAELGLLTLNAPFNMIKTRPDSEVMNQKYFSSTDEVIRLAEKVSKPSRRALGVAKGFNVVVLIIESLSTEDLGKMDGPSYMPFLFSLADKSSFFQYHFANSRRSIEGVPAVLCGIPAFMDQSIIMSDFGSNRLDCLPKILRERGYESYFLHGAHNGSFHFDTFSNMASFDHFVGQNEFPDQSPSNMDPYWGVLDEPMLQHAIHLIDTSKKPVFVSVFTLSSHSPYYIPPEYKGKFPKGTAPIHESLGYADHALKRFFEVAQTRDWFKKTIFVITGDHTHPMEKDYSYRLDHYRVPLFVYTPGLTLKSDPDRITQHVDILPTVLDLVGIDRPDRLLLGQSVFDQGLEGKAYNYVPEGYWYLDSKSYVFYDRLNNTVHVSNQEHAKTTTERTMSDKDARALPELQSLLALAQYFNMGLLNNRLYDWKKASGQAEN